MKVINNDIIDLEIISNKIPPTQRGISRCMSCGNPYKINDKKIKWRSKINMDSHSVWKTQCGNCVVNTMTRWTNQFNEILQRNIIEVSPIGN